MEYSAVSQPPLTFCCFIQRGTSSCTVAEQIEALRNVAGNNVVALIKPQPDAQIARIVEGWPRNFAPERVVALGFVAENSFDEIVAIYMAEDMPNA